MQQLSRLTLAVDEAAVAAAALAPGAPLPAGYDIVAVQPLSERVLQQVSPRAGLICELPFATPLLGSAYEAQVQATARTASLLPVDIAYLLPCWTMRVSGCGTSAGVPQQRLHTTFRLSAYLDASF